MCKVIDRVCGVVSMQVGRIWPIDAAGGIIDNDRIDWTIGRWIGWMAICRMDRSIRCVAWGRPSGDVVVERRLLYIRLMNKRIGVDICIDRGWIRRNAHY